MRHKNKVVKFSRPAAQRKALVRSLATSLVLHGRLKTTLIRAKALRPIVERYITKAKNNNLITRRLLMGFFYQEKAVNKLLNEIGPKYKERAGGYTRIIKLNVRKGDDAPIGIIELI